MDTGNLGEFIFGKWCHQVDLTPYKSHADKDGFDFIVALPKTFDEGLKTLDKDNSHSQILVQVKATKKEKGNRSIKLSNLKKLVDSPLPAFYLLILLSEEGEPISAHIFHVWDKIIFRVLKKLRTIPREKWKELNKTYLTLSWNAAQKIERLNGHSMYQVINDNLIDDVNEYSKQKEKLKKTVGYEEEVGQIKFQSILPDKYKGDIEDFMVDLYLGEIEKVEVSDWERIDNRFGDEIIVDKQEGGYFSLINIEPEGPATIKFMTKDHRSSVEINTEFFVPRGIGQLVKDEKKWKILYKAPFIKFFIYPEGKKIDFQFETPDFSKETKLNEIVDISNLMLFLSELKEEERVEFEVANQDKPFLGGSLNFNQYKEQLTIEYFRSIKSANALLNYLNLKNDVIVKPTELKSQIGVLNFFYELLAPKPLYMKLEFWVKADLKNYTNTICLVPFTVNIGNYVIPLEVKVQGDPVETGEIDGDKIFYELKSNDVRIEQHRILKKDKADLKREHEKMKKVSLKKYDTDDDVMVIHLDQNA